MPNFEKSVYIDVCTFDSLRNKSQQIINLVNKILGIFVTRYNMDISILIKKYDGRFKKMQYNLRNWDKLTNMIYNNEIRHLLLSYILYEELNQPEFALSITFDYAYKDELYKNKILANNMSLSLNLRLFEENIPNDVQVEIKSIFLSAFKALNGVVGYVNVGFPHATITPNSTIYEGIQGYSFTSFSIEFDCKARGYFWGNILTEKHIEKLGGIGSIKNKAPCYNIEEIKFGNRSAVYLQLTPNINNYTDEQLVQLRDYIKPILHVSNYDEIKRLDPEGDLRKKARVFFD